MREVLLVFGSNTEGRHGKGMALEARTNWGAKYGNPIGPQGNSYAIVTKNLALGRRSVSISFITAQLNDLHNYVNLHLDQIFLVSAIGCGLAGFEINEIRELLLRYTWPHNVYINVRFFQE